MPRQPWSTPILGLLSVLLIPVMSCLAAEVSKEFQVFEINLATAGASKLKLCPQLLKLTRVVRKK